MLYSRSQSTRAIPGTCTLRAPPTWSSSSHRRSHVCITIVPPDVYIILCDITSRCWRKGGKRAILTTVELWCSVTMPTLLAAPFLLFDKLLFLLVRKCTCNYCKHYSLAVGRVFKGFLQAQNIACWCSRSCVGKCVLKYLDLPSCRLTLARLAAVMTVGRACNYLLIIRS